MPNPNHPAVAAYFRALGEFMHEFGQTENHLAFMLLRYVHDTINEAYRPHIPPDTGVVSPHPLSAVLRALLGTQRSKPLSDIVEAVLRATGTGEAERAEMGETLGQFGHIRFIRDKIAHQGAWPEDRLEQDGTLRWRSTPHQGREPKDIKTYYFTATDLEAAALDLQAIRGRIDVILLTQYPDLRRMMELRGHYRPWRYKPVQPAPSPKAPRPTR